MTTLDTLLDSERVAAIERKRAERKPTDWHRVRLALFLAIPILCGLIVARVRVAASMWRAAFLVSMADGMTQGRTEHNEVTAPAPTRDDRTVR